MRYIKEAPTHYWNYDFNYWNTPYSKIYTTFERIAWLQFLSRLPLTSITIFKFYSFSFFFNRVWVVIKTREKIGIWFWRKYGENMKFITKILIRKNFPIYWIIVAEKFWLLRVNKKRRAKKVFSQKYSLIICTAWNWYNFNFTRLKYIYWIKLWWNKVKIFYS